MKTGDPEENYGKGAWMLYRFEKGGVDESKK